MLAHASLSGPLPGCSLDHEDWIKSIYIQWACVILDFRGGRGIVDPAPYKKAMLAAMESSREPGKELEMLRGQLGELRHELTVELTSPDWPNTCPRWSKLYRKFFYTEFTEYAQRH